ncbi:MAG: tetratricopeptide repeat protein [Chloroflexota bacterium]
MKRTNEKFAKLLTEAIYQIRLREHKNIAIVQDEVGYAIGREGGSPIEYWRKGHVPKEREEIELLSQELVDRGNLEKEWLIAFLDAAEYILPEPLIQDLYPDQSALPSSSDKTIMMPSTQARAVQYALPTPPHQLIGREKELEACITMLEDEECRLITMIGPGGIGKTRLALEIGHQLMKEGKYQDGIIFTSLASLSDPEEIPGALAAALKLALHTSQNVTDQLSNYLQSLDLLIIIDNFDPFVSEGSVHIARILQQTSSPKIIITSRERLNIRWEHVYSIKGLDHRESRSGSMASTFFKGLVSRFTLDYAFTAEDDQAIDRICQSVEGFPLALELAASWSNILSCAEIADEIDQNLDILSTSQHDVPERHRSLRAVCHYSVETLSPKEKGMFERLAVFRGGFTRNAAAKVAGASLADLSRLVNKSLLRTAGRNRFDMHQILQQFAQEQLEQHPELEAEVREAHSRYYCGRLFEVVPSLDRFNHQAMLTDVASDLENVRQAWRWALDHQQLDLVDQAMNAVFLFFQMSSRFQEGNAELNYARQRLPQDSLTLARLYNRQGLILYRLMQIDEAIEILKRSVEIHEALGETVEIPMAHNFLVTCEVERGNLDQAMHYLQENQKLEANNKTLVFKSATQNNLGFILSLLGRHQEGREAFQRAETNLLKLNQAWGLGTYYHFRGDATYYMGDYEEAETYYREAAATFAEIYYDLGTCWTRSLVGEALIAQNKLAAAEKELRQALELAHKTHAVQIELRCLMGLSKLPGFFEDEATQDSVASLLAQHPAAESDVREWAISRLGGKNPRPYGRNYGQWLTQYVQQVLNS